MDPIVLSLRILRRTTGSWDESRRPTSTPSRFGTVAESRLAISAGTVRRGRWRPGDTDVTAVTDGAASTADIRFAGLDDPETQVAASDPPGRRTPSQGAAVADLALERVNEITAIIRERASDALRETEARIAESRTRLSRLQQELSDELFSELKDLLNADDLRSVADTYTRTAQTTFDKLVKRGEAAPSPTKGAKCFRYTGRPVVVSVDAMLTGLYDGSDHTPTTVSSPSSPRKSSTLRV